MIEIRNLTKRYEDFTLNIPALTMDRSKIYGLLGKNGAGKTTLMNCIIGQLDYDGSISIDGLSYKENRERILQQLGYVGDRLFFYRESKVSEFFEFVSSFYQNWDEAEKSSLIRTFRLEKYLRHKLSALSRGTALKVALVACLSSRHQYIVLDEPTSGLDLETRDDFYRVLKEHRDPESLVLFSTHLTEDVEELADQIILISDGSLLFHKSKEILLHESDTGHLRSVLKSILTDGKPEPQE
ncbi:MAG: ABC transporter ATP-binding protein [Clostridium sp.]|jgi:ABC-2 type transport system ATP-binding protein|nr:ABC transporter ATP-binding protein [Clostridium sp.]